MSHAYPGKLKISGNHLDTVQLRAEDLNVSFEEMKI